MNEIFIWVFIFATYRFLKSFPPLFEAEYSLFIKANLSMRFNSMVKSLIGHRERIMFKFPCIILQCLKIRLGLQDNN